MWAPAWRASGSSGPLIISRDSSNKRNYLEGESAVSGMLTLQPGGADMALSCHLSEDEHLTTLAAS